MPKDKYFPDTDEPHIHQHKGGVDFTRVGHAHKKLKDGDQVRRANCQAVIDDLKNGNDREKQIVGWIKKNLL
jgi:hypothetical protein